ncbi:MAG: alkaline phosphatase family protein [Lachnospiraceae bacterium]|nr:alkaline phosphatase family protein [Lachnospiraceae bacterium]
MKKEIIWPDHKNCIANLPNSLLKHYGIAPKGDSLPLLDARLARDYKNIVVLLLDGMGKVILERHLQEDGAFRSHLAGIYESVFLSTTVAATTSVLSGLEPCEHAWLGWDNYYPQIDKNVTVFLNTIQGTDEPAAPYNVAQTFTPYESVPELIGKSGIETHMVATFLDKELESIDDICAKIKEHCEGAGRHFIYAYDKDPDGLLHRNGCGSQEVHEELVRMEAAVGRLSKELEDALIIVTADHGHIDTRGCVIKDYPKISDCLLRMPSLEPRVLNLFIKEGKKEIFREEFEREFGEDFLLMPMEEVLEKKLLGTGTPHREFRGMLGDFLAIATGDLGIYNDEEKWVSLHGSLTADEMLIPLIVFDTKEHKG